MMGGDLFHRFFLRFLVGLVLAFLVFLPLVHVFQKRVVNAEWRKDLAEQARWCALHTSLDIAEMIASAWGTTHRTIRVTFFDDARRHAADSQPDRSPPDLDLLLAGGDPLDYLAAVEPMPTGGWVVMSRPIVPGFPTGLQWELIVSAVLIVAIVAGYLRPLVRSMSATLRQLTGVAEEVAAGHVGKRLDIERTDELGTLVTAFNDMSAKLAEAEQLSTRLLHDVSHELRSPLGRIQVMAETIALHPEKADECIRGIGQEVALLDRLVGELVETARIEAEAGAARRETFELTAWAEETLHRLELEAGSRGITVTKRIPDDRIQARGDPQRLAQAIGNLVGNAINVLEGRPEARIEIDLVATNDHWTLTVDDNGPGISDADLPHVFRRFYRVDEHRGREGGGVGLGLSLVRAIAAAHGGEASIESRPGHGTRATLSIPTVS